MMHTETITKNWEALYHAQLKTIESEAQYLEMLEFIGNLMRSQNTNQEPHLGLWRLAVGYIAQWEATHDELASAPLESAAVLRGLMDVHNLTQSQLAARVGITQSHLSRILCGERVVSPKLARSLERVFRVKI
jgi:antitoxin component HigA of HigAB toxin-antitoxin module